MWIDYTDIIPGLEEAWAKIFQYAALANPFLIFASPRNVSRRKYTKLSQRSLIILWAPLYDSFTSLRRAGWDAYWLTLPYGSHSGANGWPGSGFSAFIWLNAPRYRLGLPLLLDPGASYGPELVPNNDFASAAGWSFDDYSEWNAGSVRVHEVAGEYAGYVHRSFGSTLPNSMYHVEIEVEIPSGITGAFTPLWGTPSPAILAGGITTTGSGLYLGIGTDSSPLVRQTLVADVNYGNTPTTNGFAVNFSANGSAGYIYLYRVSLRRILTP